MTTATEGATKSTEGAGQPTDETLHDAAITATEAWQENPTDETKKTAKDAVAAAKTAVAKTRESNAKVKEEATAKEKSDKATAEASKAELLKYGKTELKLPENSPLNDTHLDTVVDFSKKHGMSKEGAQALLERENAAIQAHSEAQEAAKDVVVENWKTAIGSDKELGGDNLNEVAIVVKKVNDRFFSKELQEKLVETGLGNYPELVRALHKIGKSMSPAQLEIPGSQTGDSGKKEAADVLYGGTKIET